MKQSCRQGNYFNGHIKQKIFINKLYIYLIK